MPEISAAAARDPQHQPVSAAACTAPFAGFVLCGAIESTGGPALYPWMYVAKVAVVCGLLWSSRRCFPPLESRGIWLAVAAGTVGFAVWIATAGLTQARLLGGILPAGLLAGSRSQFDPFASIDSPAGRLAFLTVRLFGLAIVVPLAEELFWRGFLARYLLDPQFDRVEYGTFTVASFSIVTLAFAAVHPELVAAILWCCGINLLLRATRNLWACIVMHAVTNGLLGAYVICTREWALW